MLEGNSVVLKCLEHASAETDLGVHHVLFNVYGAEALAACDTCDDVIRGSAGVLNDESTGILGSVCIFDIDWNTGLSYREDGILMEYGSTHV